MQSRVLSPVDQARSAAKFLADAVAPDGLADHWRESYVCETGKSMKALGLAAASERFLLQHRQSTHHSGIGSPLGRLVGKPEVDSMNECFPRRTENELVESNDGRRFTTDPDRARPAASHAEAGLAPR